MITTAVVSKLVFLCSAGFVASFVDSIAGGGGLINLPAFLAAGVSPYLALGTNKFSSAMGAFTSSMKFFRSGKTNMDLLKYLIPFTFAGAALGVTTVLKIDEKILSTLVLILVLFMGIYTFFSKNIGSENKFRGLSKLNVGIGIIFAFSLGFYDGFFGPGAGSLLIFGFIKIFGFDFVHAAGNAKILNFVSNITSVFLFAFHGHIDYMLGIPVALAMILGAKFGTTLAIKKGAKLIKPIFIVMSIAVAIKLVL